MAQHNDTKYGSLEDTLSAIGKAAFVRFYYDFKDTTVTTDVLSKKILRESPGAKSSRQGFRIPRARHIFATGQQLDALRIIIASDKVDPDARLLAQIILDKELFLADCCAETRAEQEFIQSLDKEIIYKPKLEFEYDNTPKFSRVPAKIEVQRYHRSRIVAHNALRKAGYLCEVDSSHLLFIRKNSDIPYTEPHHLIPLSAAGQFNGIELDREQNVVSLCSGCHNWLHYGSNIDIILKPLYEKRCDLLRLIGIDVSYEKLRAFYE